MRRHGVVKSKPRKPRRDRPNGSLTFPTEMGIGTEDDFMSGIRALVGTRKGAFVLTSDAKRKDWKVEGPHFAGWEIYHMKGSPVDPDRIYASQTSAWFGQIIQRSDDGGKNWFTPGTSEEDLRG